MIVSNADMFCRNPLSCFLFHFDLLGQPIGKPLKLGLISGKLLAETLELCFRELATVFRQTWRYAIKVLQGHRQVLVINPEKFSNS